MTQIPDQAVQAAHAEYHKVLSDTNRSDPMLAALTAASPYLTASVEVSRLIWKDLDNGGSSCETDGKYSIDFWPREKLYVDAYTKMMRRKSLSEAKEAMQGQFERFIKPYIVTKPVDVAAVLPDVESICVWMHSAYGDNHSVPWMDRRNSGYRTSARREVGKVLAAIRALSPAKPVDQRQDIATAPRDGSDILAYFPEDEGWLRVRWQGYRWELNPDGGTEFDYDIEGNPTHWMPLPAAPTSTREAGE